jgi:hypothetical protein
MLRKEKIKTWKFLESRPREKRKLGRRRYGLKDNFKMEFKEVRCEGGTWVN